jgi:hypothetical protein
MGVPKLSELSSHVRLTVPNRLGTTTTDRVSESGVEHALGQKRARVPQGSNPDVALTARVRRRHSGADPRLL